MPHRDRLELVDTTLDALSRIYMQRCTCEAMSTGDKVFAVRLQTTQHAKRGMIEDCVIWKWFGWRCTNCKTGLKAVLLVRSSLHASPVRVLIRLSF